MLAGNRILEEMELGSGVPLTGSTEWNAGERFYRDGLARIGEEPVERGSGHDLPMADAPSSSSDLGDCGVA